MKTEQAYRNFCDTELQGFAHTESATRKAFNAGVRHARPAYLSGPMSNLPEWNFPAFHDAAAHLRAAGHRVINPAEINTDTTASWADCLRADIVALMDCHVVYRLPGWEQSKGARLELHIADALGMEILDFEGVE